MIWQRIGVTNRKGHNRILWIKSKHFKGKLDIFKSYIKKKVITCLIREWKIKQLYGYWLTNHVSFKTAGAQRRLDYLWDSWEEHSHTIGKWLMQSGFCENVTSGRLNCVHYVLSSLLRRFSRILSNRPIGTTWQTLNWNVMTFLSNHWKTFS